jgi:peptide/nickel transport system permease protein
MSVLPAPRVHARSRVVARFSSFGPLVVVAGTICVLLILAAVFAPLVAPHDPNAIDPINVLMGSSADHPLGTDDTGRDLLSRLVYGARPSLAGPAIVMLLASTSGAALALVAGWYGGWVDGGLSRLIDVLFAFPGLIIAIIAAAVFGAGFTAPVVALAIAYTPLIARVLRSAVVKQRSLAYVEALRVQGSSGLAICFKHIVPNVAPLMFVQFAVGFGYAMLDLAAISFLGLGIQPPTADWGVMAANGKAAIPDGNPQQSLYAALVVVVAVVCFNLVGEHFARRFEAEDVI